MKVYPKCQAKTANGKLCNSKSRYLIIDKDIIMIRCGKHAHNWYAYQVFRII
jgi:hypothetical protein